MSDQSTSNSKGFDAQRDGSGTLEWADHNENIQRGCSHNCKYCFAAANAHRFKTLARVNWHTESLTANAERTKYPKRHGVIMFPSAHDITPGNLDACTRFLKLMLDAGNQVLIVSKPHTACIAHLVAELATYRNQVMFRFTQGTMDAEVARFWEPGAPAPEERLEALRLAHGAGFRTSVSAEPLLGGLDTARAVLDAVRPFVTDTVWIGKLNRPRNRVDMKLPQNCLAIEAMEAEQSDANILALYAALQGDPLVRWKDSIMHVVNDSGPTVLDCVVNDKRQGDLLVTILAPNSQAACEGAELAAENANVLLLTDIHINSHL
ncbi:radical SAM protein [Uliginosibacterium gangwonense]|uniref:radical SAM protein n=1 Tax=Uliginosibacterium gangwonense TaxID=392736 RepID=UPI00037BFB04|nr:radical SAM protein [Uliginosibacterium gangwonense]